MKITVQKLPLQATATRSCGCVFRKVGLTIVRRDFGGSESRVRMVYVTTCWTHTREGQFDERYDVYTKGDETLSWPEEVVTSDIVSMIGGLDA